MGRRGSFFASPAQLKRRYPNEKKEQEARDWIRYAKALAAEPHKPAETHVCDYHPSPHFPTSLVCRECGRMIAKE